jgi:O-antigen/teichoic acid export membrane protein
MTKGRIRRTLSYFNLPLHRNGLALIFSLAATSGLGLFYWALAARKYSAEIVGINAAMISAMMLLGSISQLGLVNFLNRFLPKAGRAANVYILGAYLASVLAALFISVIYVFGIDLWSPTLGFLRTDYWSFAFFVVATMLWCVFALQDGVLIGLRRAAWVPVENIIFALVKIGLLLLMASLLVDNGIFISWTAPLILLVVLINLLIFRKLLPKHREETAAQAEVIEFPQIVRFVGGDYFSSLVWMLTINLMPIIVLEIAGATANAYFYLPWMITYSLYLVSQSMGMSLTTEAARDPELLDEYSFRSLLQGSALVIPAVLLVTIAAPLILRLFGDIYAAEGSTLLRLLALSALPNVVNRIYVSIARVQRRVKDIVLVLSSICGIVLVITFASLGRLGLPGVGWAWLIGQTTVAVYLLSTRFRRMLVSRVNRTNFSRIYSLLRNIKLKRRAQRAQQAMDKVIPKIFEVLPERHGLISETGWQICDVFPSLSKMIVTSLGQEQSNPEIVLYLAQSKSAKEEMQVELDFTQKLFDDPRLLAWSTLLPVFLGNGEIQGKDYWLFSHIKGASGDQVVKHADNPEIVIVAAIRAIRELHAKTAAISPVNEDHLESWVIAPIRSIKHSVLKYYHYGAARILDNLAAELGEELLDQEMAVSWIHGDYWPGNIFINKDGKEVTGIVDWEQARTRDLPFLDLVNFFLSSRRLISNYELGIIIVELLREDSWQPVEQQLWDEHARVLGGKQPSLRTALLIFWLRHVSDNLARTNDASFNPVWVVNNYLPMMNELRRKN